MASVTGPVQCPIITIHEYSHQSYCTYQSCLMHSRAYASAVITWNRKSYTGVISTTISVI